jgi:hypothetical protein
VRKRMPLKMLVAFTLNFFEDKSGDEGLVVE